MFYKKFMNARDPLSSYTHFIGACLAVLATIIMVSKGLKINDLQISVLLGIVVFGFSMIALYSTSSTYHFLNASPQVILRTRKLDHSMIYVLIAGTYTPLIIKFMAYERAAIFLSVLWGITAIGIIIKVCWLNAPRWLYTSLYLIMGWAIVFDWNFLRSIPGGCMVNLVLGGLMYSIGAGFYIAKKPNLGKNFGFHEMFHIFVILGTLFHFFAVYFYVL